MLGSRDCKTIYLDHMTETQIARYPVILYEPSRSRRVLLDKLIVPKFVVKYTTFFRAKVHCHIHKSQLRDHIPSHMYPVHAPILFLLMNTSKCRQQSLKDTASHNGRPKSSTRVILHLKIQSVPRSKHTPSRL